MLILGQKEVDNNNIGVRSSKDGDLGAMDFDEFIKKLDSEMNKK